MKNNILNKKIKVHKQPDNWVVFLFFIALAVSYILISSFRYIAKNYYDFVATKNTTENYKLKHEKEIKEKIFSNLFKESENCNSIENIELKNNCFQNISHKLALIIKEEEFISWPHDLFFVKKTGSQFFKLGWSGELSPLQMLRADNKIVINKKSIFSDFLFRRCNYFGTVTANMPAESCEIYIHMQLDDNKEGYIVRNIGLTEENSFYYNFIFPYFVIFGFIFSLPYSITSFPTNIYMLIEIIFSLLPFILAFMFVRLFNKKGKRIK